MSISQSVSRCPSLEPVMEDVEQRMASVRCHFSILHIICLRNNPQHPLCGGQWPRGQRPDTSEVESVRAQREDLEQAVLTQPR